MYTQEFKHRLMKRHIAFTILSVWGLTILIAAGSAEASSEAGIKYGYINKSGKMVIKPVFDYAKSFSEQMAAIKVGSKWGFIDNAGKIVIEPQFMYTDRFRDGLCGVAISDKNNEHDYPYINKKGKVVSWSQFSEGLAVVKIGGKYGYIDVTNTVVIKAQFDRARPFRDEVAEVWLGEKECLIDKTGRIIVETTGHLSDLDREGITMVTVRRESKSYKGYIERTTGRIIAEPMFDDGDNFSDGLARVQVGKKWGFIDKTGRMVIEPRFPQARDFREGLAGVCVDGKWGFIDRTGKVVIDFNFDRVDGSFYKGLTAVGLSKKMGVIDKAGKVVIDFRFEGIELFYPEGMGVAYVEVADRFGLIDLTGKYIIEPRFDNVHYLYLGEPGMIDVSVGSKFGIIDITGKIIAEPKFDKISLSGYNEDLMAVKLGQKWGFMDKSGKTIIDFIFDDAGHFSEGLCAVGVK